MVKSSQMLLRVVRLGLMVKTLWDIEELLRYIGASAFSIEYTMVVFRLRTCPIQYLEIQQEVLKV
jgi:hypothetical protein